MDPFRICGCESDRFANQMCDRQAATFANVMVEYNGEMIDAALHLCKEHARRLWRNV